MTMQQRGYEIACAIQQGYSADLAGVVAAGVTAALTPDATTREWTDRYTALL